MSNRSPYCIGAVGHDGDPKSVLNTFDDVMSYLRTTRNSLADEYADRRAESCAEPETLATGGFGVWLRNRWGSELEVGVGLDVRFLIRLIPAPRKWLSDRPTTKTNLVFYLDGGHYTELQSRQLVSRETAVKVLGGWLELNEFPVEAAVLR